jgi:hypothetical protein
MKQNTNIQINPIFSETGRFVYRAEDTISQRGMDFSIQLSRHAVKRSSQRGIDSYKLALALEYGEMFMKQGLIYYVLGEKNLPESLSANSNNVKNIVLVCNSQTGEVITCYRSSRAFSRIKHKSKRLYVKSKDEISRSYRNIA